MYNKIHRSKFNYLDTANNSFNWNTSSYTYISVPVSFRNNMISSYIFSIHLPKYYYTQKYGKYEKRDNAPETKKKKKQNYYSAVNIR